MIRAVLAVTVGLAAAATLVGCSVQPPAASGGSAAGSASPTPIPTNVVVEPQDSDAFVQLAKVAPTSLKLEGGTVRGTTCWTPSQHLFNNPSVATAGTWKVLCRVYYDLKGADRYQDATCIGDFDKTPMLDHCYVWEYYSGEAKYADDARLSSPAPTPLP